MNTSDLKIRICLAVIFIKWQMCHLERIILVWKIIEFVIKRNVCKKKFFQICTFKSLLGVTLIKLLIYNMKQTIYLSSWWNSHYYKVVLCRFVKEAPNDGGPELPIACLVPVVRSDAGCYCNDVKMTFDFELF